MTALLFGGTAAAQQPGTLLLGGFGQYTKFDDALQLDDVFGVGGRAGAYFAPNWNLEAENSYNRPEQTAAGQQGKIWYGPVSARIRYSFPFAGLAAFHIGAGGVITSYAGYEPDEPTGTELRDIRANRRGYNYGVEGNVGFTLGLGGISLRVDGIADYMPNGGRIGGTGSAANQLYESHTNLRAQAGLEFRPNIASLFGGGSYGNESLAPWAPMMWFDDLGTDWALPGMLELGVFGQYTKFDENAPGNPKDGIGYGGRVGVFLTDTRFELEGDGQHTPGLERDPLPPAGFNRNEINYTTFALRMLYNIPIAARSQFILGVGGVRTNYSTETAASNREFSYNYGVSGLAGLRFGLANRVALRLDGIAEYMKDTENLNLIGRAGLSLLVGGARREAMCTYAGLENIPASSPQCVPPALPPPPAPVAMCPYPNLGSITATDPACVAPPSQPMVDTAAITGPIYFDFDKSDIRPDAAATLDRKVPWLQANPGMRIRIEGNADERGSDEYNLALGQRRAAAAKRYLVEKGLDAGRFDLVSYGEERPVCTESNEDCWQRNRRDDFVIVTVGSDAIVVPPGGEE
ncbi:MAG: peptidoglycan-associated lipoprotein Pal [Gemmatimonadaceae bacterium]|nr:peptidoglycan-associated lipoprotein Pal [Gemmatimonadaceae bacterium]